MSDDNAATITATSTIKKAKSAYLYYQSEMLSKIRNEMGGSSAVSMGDAMTEVCYIDLYVKSEMQIYDILWYHSNSWITTKILLSLSSPIGGGT
jgi:hypothetical protein